MNEACLNASWVGCDLTDKRAQDFTKAVLVHMRERLSDYQEMYGDLYNLEATPAESTAYRLAKHDTERYPDIITASEPGGTPYYTNSSHLPVGFTDDIFEALDIQDELQTLYTSGTVFHTFLGEKLPDWRAAASLVRKIAENYKLPYYTLSPTYSICRQHGYISGSDVTRNKGRGISRMSPAGRSRTGTTVSCRARRPAGKMDGTKRIPAGRGGRYRAREDKCAAGREISVYDGLPPELPSNSPTQSRDNAEARSPRRTPS